MLTDDGEGLCYALGLQDRTNIGMRRDSLGASDFTYQFPTALPNCGNGPDREMISSRWQTAPFIVEPYGNGSSPTFPCQTFTVDATTGVLDFYEDIERYHIAAVKNASFCTGAWSTLTTPEQQAVLWSGVHAGYRLAPNSISVESPPQLKQSARFLFLKTCWTNTGVTPAYDEWTVIFSLWTDVPGAEQKEVERFASGVDLRKVLPTGNGSFTFTDDVELPADFATGQYEMRMRVVDAADYMLPMQLALQKRMADGSYPLGLVTIE
jgi:hypothetical protein